MPFWQEETQPYVSQSHAFTALLRAMIRRLPGYGFRYRFKCQCMAIITSSKI